MLKATPRFLTQGVPSTISLSGCFDVSEQPWWMSEATEELGLFVVFLSVRTPGDLQFWSDLQQFCIIQSEDI